MKNPIPSPHSSCFEKFIQLLTALGGGAGIVALLIFTASQFGDRRSEPDAPKIQPTPSKSNQTFSSNPPLASPIQKQLVIVDKFGNSLQLSEGLFSSLEQCENSITQRADAYNYASCVSPPNNVICSNIVDIGDRSWWECYTNTQSCQKSLELHTLESEARVEAGQSKRSITTSCEMMALNQALSKYQ